MQCYFTWMTALSGSTSAPAECVDQQWRRTQRVDSILAETDAWILALILAVAMSAAWRVGWWLGNGLRAPMALLSATTMSLRWSCLASDIPNVKAGLEELLRRSQQMQAQMTDLAVEAVNEGTPIAVSLTNALNALTSNHAARLAAAKDRLPANIVVLLFVSAIMSSMLVGREQGLASRLEVAGTLSYILLVTLAVYVTLDLNQPQTGMVTVSQEPLQRLLSSMPR
jgi:hypothetical protein